MFPEGVTRVLLLLDEEFLLALLAELLEGLTELFRVVPEGLTVVLLLELLEDLLVLAGPGEAEELLLLFTLVTFRELLLLTPDVLAVLLRLEALPEGETCLPDLVPEELLDVLTDFFC